MKSAIRLFKGVPVTDTKVEGDRFINQLIAVKTIPYGFIISPDIIMAHTPKQIEQLIEEIKTEFGMSGTQANSSFHKSWNKVKNASIEQLVMEQVIHYFTTYGFEALGCYDDDSIYIPNEKLETPELDIEGCYDDDSIYIPNEKLEIPELDIEGFKLIVINGFTSKELKEKLLTLVSPGIALKEQTVKDVVDIATFLEFDENEIVQIKNKEVMAMMYDYLGLFPESSVEFLRYLVYKATDKTLLIKNKETIETIKAKNNLDVLGLLNRYEEKYGLEKLAEIFYRFKPLWLAFRTSKQLKVVVNKLRRLAVKYHKPMQEDYLNSVTAKIQNGKGINLDELSIELGKVNIFRKIRLLYAINYRIQEPNSIMYKIRNGKGYAKEFEFEYSYYALELDSIREIILEDIAESLKELKDKKIYIPEHINYALPSTEKQFTGNVPSGSYVSIKEDMIFGIYWDNVERNQIDLDLSVMSENEKFGWDSGYRNTEGSILFSGDITTAPKGASELFYIGNTKEDKTLLLNVNYYNFDSDIPVPFKIIVAKEKPEDFKHNYMVDPNNIVAVASSTLDKKQKMLGIITVKAGECRFYFSETDMGSARSARNSEVTKHARQYLFDYYTNSIGLKEVLELAGAILADNNEECDIDLSYENLNKNSIINLLNNKL